MTVKKREELWQPIHIKMILKAQNKGKGEMHLSKSLLSTAKYLPT